MKAESQEMLRQLEVDARFVGWLSCRLPDATAGAVVRVEMKGPDNTLRLRQIKVWTPSNRHNVYISIMAVLYENVL